jgi:hypothetical protein
MICLFGVNPLTLAFCVAVSTASAAAAGGGGGASGGKMCEHCQTSKAQAKVTFNGVTLKLCKPCLDVEQKRVHLARLCERCAQGKQVSLRSFIHACITRSHRGVAMTHKK